MNKINLKLKSKNFSDLIQKLQNLSQIDDTIKIKIESDKTLIYSMIQMTQIYVSTKRLTWW